MSLVSSIFHTSSLFQFSLHTFTSEKNVVLPVYDDMDYMWDGFPDWVNLSETHFNQHSQTYPVDAEVTLAMVEFWSDDDTFCALFSVSDIWFWKNADTFKSNAFPWSNWISSCYYQKRILKSGVIEYLIHLCVIGRFLLYNFTASAHCTYLSRKLKLNWYNWGKMCL